MSWLHRLQQRISITRHEALTLIALSLFLTLGIAGRHACRSIPQFGPEVYADVDSLFAAHSADLVDGRSAGPVNEAARQDFAVPESHFFQHDATRKDPSLPKRDSIVAPSVPESAASVPQSNDSEGANRLIDINRATASDLTQLPRVGPKIAERIMAFRETFGPFQSVEELTSVKGIGPKTLEQIRPYAYVAPPPEP